MHQNPTQARLREPLRSAAIAALCIGLTAGSAAFAATVPATMVLLEGDSPPGADGQTVTSVNAPFTDSLGNIGFTGGLTTDLGGTDNFVWYDGSVIWRNSDAPESLSGAEGTMGVSDTAGFIYSPAIDGDDGVYRHNGLLAVEGEPAPDFAPPAATTFHSRPTMTPDGTAYWIAGIDPTGGGSSAGRALYMSTGAMPGTITKVIGFGDIVDGLPIDDGSGVDFDYSISDNGNHAHFLLLETGDTNTDGHMYVNGTTVAQEASPSGDGDNWDNFDGMSINNDGDYIFSGDTDGDSGSDEFIAHNASIVLREGDTVGGVTLTSFATVSALSLNNLGQSAFIWSYSGAETLFFACDASDPVGTGVALLTTGDELDLTGNGIGDGFVEDFNASGVVGPGLSLGENGSISVEIDFDNGAELEAVVSLALPSCGGVSLVASGSCPGEVTLDASGATGNSQLAILRGTGAGSDVIPAGPCAGTMSGLSGLSLVSIFPTAPDGSFSISRELGGNVCGAPLQALDVATCTLSPVVNLP